MLHLLLSKNHPLEASVFAYKVEDLGYGRGEGVMFTLTINRTDGDSRLGFDECRVDELPIIELLTKWALNVIDEAEIGLTSF